jgi:methylisocitrate lyase
MLMAKMTTKLRDALRDGMVVAASCYDPLSARLAEIAGLEALHVTGMGVEIGHLGAPDLGLITLTELADQVARMASAVSIPMLCDVDTGFGGILNIQRTIREMERAGAGGVHLEDQAQPKHCPLIGGRQVVGREEALDRLKAALDARTDPDFVIIARTDSDVISFEEAVERCNLYLEAGADLAMPILMRLPDGRNYFSLPPAEQMEWLGRLVELIDGPVLGYPPPAGYTAADLAGLGYAMTRFPATAIGAAANAMAKVFEEIKKNGNDTGYIAANPGPYFDPLELMKAVHLDRYTDIERRYSSTL